MACNIIQCRCDTFVIIQVSVETTVRCVGRLQLRIGSTISDIRSHSASVQHRGNISLCHCKQQATLYSYICLLSHLWHCALELTRRRRHAHEPSIANWAAILTYDRPTRLPRSRDWPIDAETLRPATSHWNDITVSWMTVVLIFPRGQLTGLERSQS